MKTFKATNAMERTEPKINAMEITVVLQTTIRGTLARGVMDAWCAPKREC